MNRFGNKLGTIFASNASQNCIHHEEFRQAVDDILRFELRRYIKGHAAASILIDDGKPLERVTALYSIKEKVPTPYVVRIGCESALAGMITVPARLFFLSFPKTFSPLKRQRRYTR